MTGNGHSLDEAVTCTTYGDTNCRSLAISVDVRGAANCFIRLMSLVLPVITALTETWHDADRAVLSRLRSATYNVIDRARPCTANNLSVNHGGIAFVAGANIALSPNDNYWLFC